MSLLFNNCPSSSVRHTPGSTVELHFTGGTNCNDITSKGTYVNDGDVQTSVEACSAGAGTVKVKLPQCDGEHDTVLVEVIEGTDSASCPITLDC